MRAITPSKVYISKDILLIAATLKGKMDVSKQDISRYVDNDILNKYLLLSRSKILDKLTKELLSTMIELLAVNRKVLETGGKEPLEKNMISSLEKINGDIKTGKRKPENIKNYICDMYDGKSA